MPSLTPSARDGSAVRDVPRAIRSSALVLAAFCAPFAPRSIAAAGFEALQGSGLRLPPVAPADGTQDGEVLTPADRLGSSGAVDESGIAPVFVEVESAHPTAFVGELLSIEVRFGLDAEFLAESVIPLFRRHLDVPVQLEVDWLDDAESLELTRLFVEVARESQVSIARNDRLALARRLPDRVVNGRAFRVYALDVRRIERTPGTLRLASPRLVFARATAFTEDFVNGRTPTERRDAYVIGRGLEIEVAPLPELGRPVHFSGAVGAFQADARLESDASAKSLRYELSIHGDGDLRDAVMPDASSFPGLRVQGVLDDRGSARRTIAYDLVPAGIGARRIGLVEFHAFDPRPPGTYVTLAPPSVDLPDFALPKIGTDPVEPVGFAARGSILVLLGTAAGILLAVLALVVAVARRTRKRTGGGPP